MIQWDFFGHGFSKAERTEWRVSGRDLKWFSFLYMLFCYPRVQHMLYLYHLWSNSSHPLLYPLWPLITTTNHLCLYTEITALVMFGPCFLSSAFTDLVSTFAQWDSTVPWCQKKEILIIPGDWVLSHLQAEKPLFLEHWIWLLPLWSQDFSGVAQTKCPDLPMVLRLTRSCAFKA